MAKLSKRRKAIKALTTGENASAQTFAKAVELLKGFSNRPKFSESLDVAVNLGVDARKSDQNVRGAIVLPHGTGRTVRVAVFAEGDDAKKAEEAGADVIGMDDLVEQFQKGTVDVDVVVATPRAMPKVGKLGQILGPRGLMPNPKLGTVTQDVAKAVIDAKCGQARYRTDKNGIVHCSIGKLDFETVALEENLNALLGALKRSKPTTAKGTYFKKVTVSSTMGPGLLLDLSTLPVA